MASQPQTPRVVRFGVFEVDLHQRELRKGGLKLKLHEQPFQVLSSLLECPGEIVTREKLRQILWPAETFVDFDHGLNTSVNKLRDVLGDSADTPRFIETLPRRGYRFIAPVSAELTIGSAGSVKRIPLPPVAPTADAERRFPTMVGLGRQPAVLLTITVVVILLGLGLVLWRINPGNAAIESRLIAVPLTTYPGYERFPSVSPDGTRVAFSWTGAELTKPNIYIKLIGPGEPVRLTASSQGDFSPAWSPDGRFIAFMRARNDNGAAIVVIPALGGQERDLTLVNFESGNILGHWARLRPPPYLTWSANGRWLLSIDKGQVIRVSVDTGEKKALTFPPATGTGDAGLALSPDGNTLAFTRTAGLVADDIYVVSLSEELAAKAEPRQITFDGTEIDGLAWMPNGRDLVFSSTRGGRLELWRIAAMGSGRLTRVGDDGEDPSDLDISRQGQRLVYSHEFQDENIWRVALNGSGPGRPANFISSTKAEVYPQYSPDGTRIAFESNRTGREEVWVCNEDASSPSQVTSLGKWSGSPRWSPDGKRIAFDSNAAGNWDVYVVASQGGRPTRLTTNSADDDQPSWSHDGMWIYFRSNRTGRNEIWKIHATTRSEVQVTRNGGGSASESADGEDLYFLRAGALWRVPSRGGQESKLLESSHFFSPTRHGIYFIQGQMLRFLDFRTHSTRSILSLGPVSSGISVSPDGRWMLYSRIDHEGSDLMLIDGFH